ncbi:MAG: menaquinol-cytochrome c reductase cytochrome b subunit [Acidimicrobiia bacterium]|nr:menaquinol-cytochrome c reductase cytochrome b subunit [Acidimicrobiia bacterium]
MTDIPEHLLKRSQERRKALGLPTDDEGDDAGEAAGESAPEADTGGAAEEAAPAASDEAAPAAASAESAASEDAAEKSGVPAHLLERSRRRRASLAGDDPDAGGGAAGGGAAAPAAAGAGAATATATAAPAPTVTGPGGHTQRLLTVVKSGSIQQTRAQTVDKVHTWPHLLVIEFSALLLLTALVFIFSAVVRAPLLGLADFNATPNPSKAPWYFLGLQELLTMFQPMVAGVTIPGIGLFLLILAPYVDKNPSNKPEDRKFAISLFTLFLMFWAVLVIIGSFFRGTGFNFLFPWDNPIFFEL